MNDRGFVDGGGGEESSDGIMSDVSKKFARKGNRVRRNLYYKRKMSYQR